MTEFEKGLLLGAGLMTFFAAMLIVIRESVK